MNATLPSQTEIVVDEVSPALPQVGPFAQRLPVLLRIVHIAIIANLAIQVLYGCFQIFYILQPPGLVGPMFGHAADLPFELMMARRMYALETWVAFGGLAIYIAITEVLPRRWP